MFDALRRVVDRMRAGETRLPAHVRVSADHVIGDRVVAAEPFEAGRHYFGVRINELFLAEDRRWFQVAQPMVWTLTEMLYDGVRTQVPFPVGPSLLGHGQQVPRGMLFSDTRVAGVHPYQGDRLAITVVLNRVEIDNYVDRLLSIIETTTGAFNVASMLGPYLQMARSVVEGVETLLDLGTTAPVVGCRHELDSGAGQSFGPGFFALLADEDSIDPNELWVKDRRLVIGADPEAAQPPRSDDYVLYSLTQTSERDDARSLPFVAPLWRRVVEYANRADDESWNTAKAAMATLGQELALSADLVRAQGGELFDELVDEMVGIHERAVSLAHRGAETEGAVPSDDAIVRNIATRVLEL